jgi:hypothetical protein
MRQSSHTLNRLVVKSNLVLSYDRRSVDQSVLVSSTHLGLTTRYLLLSDSCGFVDVERSPSREDGSVIYNCCWHSPAQPFSGPSPVGLATILYCLRFETSSFCRLLLLAGLRWRNSIPPPHGETTSIRYTQLFNHSRPSQFDGS